MSPPKRFCIHGHDTWLFGRARVSGNCLRCQSERVRNHVPDELRKRWRFANVERFLELQDNESDGVQVPDSRCAVGLGTSPTLDVLGSPLQPWIDFYTWLATAGGNTQAWQPVDDDEAERWTRPLVIRGQKTKLMRLQRLRARALRQMGVRT